MEIAVESFKISVSQAFTSNITETNLASLKVRCLNRTLEPNVRASISSVPVA